MPKDKKKVNILGGIADLTIFLLFVVGAGFFGYFVGINQKLAPVQMVAPGTIEALQKISDSVTGNGQTVPQSQSRKSVTVTGLEPKAKGQLNSQESAREKSNPPQTEETNSKGKSEETSSSENTSKKNKPSKKSKSKSADKTKKKQQKKSTKSNSKLKYWIASTGDEYIGSSITVTVNGHPVDQFFGPGKLIDVTKKITKGTNQIRFDSKVLADDYNQHLGNNKYNLTLNLVSGNNIKENFDAKSVLLSFSRTAAQTDDGSSAVEFKAK